ncbi:hypothetical protein [Methylobacterium sp. WL1]|uniref:hypothetical protein n=1 Tax=Methylobacterium sp. WL1 TaxID=2603276 RepID=UPI0024848C5F|nr:hypothetical protein [Methylobacterium sp. WL1]
MIAGFGPAGIGAEARPAGTASAAAGSTLAGSGAVGTGTDKAEASGAGTGSGDRSGAAAGAIGAVAAFEPSAAGTLRTSPNPPKPENAASPPQWCAGQLHLERAVAEIQAGRLGAEGHAFGKRREHPVGAGDPAGPGELLPALADEAGEALGPGQRRHRPGGIAAPQEAVPRVQGWRLDRDGGGRRFARGCLRLPRRRDTVSWARQLHRGCRNHQEDRPAVVSGPADDLAERWRGDPPRVEGEAREPGRGVVRVGPGDMTGEGRAVGLPECRAEGLSRRGGEQDPPVDRVDHEMKAVSVGQRGGQAGQARPGRERSDEVGLGCSSGRCLSRLQSPRPRTHARSLVPRPALPEKHAQPYPYCKATWVATLDSCAERHTFTSCQP